MTLPRTARGLVPLLLVLCTSCAAIRSIFPSRLDPPKIDADEVPRALERSEQALAAEDWWEALRWARAVEDVRGIEPAQRQRAQALLEKAADREVSRLTAERDVDGLKDMTQLDLPRQIAVTAGLEEARILFEQGKYMKSYLALEAMDQKFPLHHERYASASLLVDIGLTLAEDDSGFLWWSKRDDGIAVLEYLVLNAPWEPRCDEAYYKLSECYAEDRNWELAVERHADLLLYHLESELRPLSQAEIPVLRLDSLRSPEYDRGEMLKARRELETWIETYGDSPSAGPGSERRVRLALADCVRRLIDSDLGIARFYRTVDNDFGQRLHATRALETAELSGDPERAERARALLADLPPPVERIPGPTPEPIPGAPVEVVEPGS